MTLNEKYCDLINSDNGFDNQLLADRCEFMAEKLVKWEPIVNLANKYCIEYINDDFNEFKVLLREIDSDKKMWMTFESVVGSYRRINKCFKENSSYKLYERILSLTALPVPTNLVVLA